MPPPDLVQAAPGVVLPGPGRGGYPLTTAVLVVEPGGPAVGRVAQVQGVRGQLHEPGVRNVRSSPAAENVGSVAGEGRAPHAHRVEVVGGKAVVAVQEVVRPILERPLHVQAVFAVAHGQGVIDALENALVDLRLSLVELHGLFDEVASRGDGRDGLVGAGERARSEAAALELAVHHAVGRLQPGHDIQEVDDLRELSERGRQIVEVLSDHRLGKGHLSIG